MNSETASQPQAKKSTIKTILAILGIIVLIGAMGFAIKLLLGTGTSEATQTLKRGSTAEIYAAILKPDGLKELEHQSITTGTPSEVYFYTVIGDKFSISNQFATNLTNSGYDVVKGTDGLIFSASKAGNISLNFTFSDTDQLKVTAI